MTKIINLCSIKCDTSFELQDWRDLESEDDDDNNNDDDNDINDKNYKKEYFKSFITLKIKIK